jgi:AraC-like DNA-binding protein
MKSPLRDRSGKDQEAVWQMTGPGHVGLLHAHYVRQVFPRHFHDSFVVCVNERGAHASWYRGSTVIIPEGAITVVSPGEVHTGRPVPGLPWHYRAMYVDAELLATLATEVGLPAGTMPSLPSLFVSDARLAGAFVRAHRRCESESDPLECEAHVADVLLTLLQRHAIGPRRNAGPSYSSQAVGRAMEFIQDCYSERLTLDRLAEAAGVSRYSVLRAFRRDVGIPPYAFVTQVRVEHAKRLLREGVAISAVSQRVGFADQSHLTRHFKRLMGVTPGAYARGVRAV